MPPLPLGAIFINFYPLSFYAFTDLLMLCIMMFHKTIALLGNLHDN
jgi:hypothetical protein